MRKEDLSIDYTFFRTLSVYADSTFKAAEISFLRFKEQILKIKTENIPGSVKKECLLIATNFNPRNSCWTLLCYENN
jgi:hypothetical protein